MRRQLADWRYFFGSGIFADRTLMKFALGLPPVWRCLSTIAHASAYCSRQ